MMKPIYETPKFEITEFDTEDVLTTSSGWTQEDENGNPESGHPDIF